MSTPFDTYLGFSQYFYKGASPSVRVNIDVAVRGTIMSKTPEDALNLFEEMSNIQSLWSNERATQRKGGALEVDGLRMLNVKLDALTKRMDKMNISAISSLALSS